MKSRPIIRDNFWINFTTVGPQRYEHQRTELTGQPNSMLVDHVIEPRPFWRGGLGTWPKIYDAFERALGPCRTKKGFCLEANKTGLLFYLIIIFLLVSLEYVIIDITVQCIKLQTYEHFTITNAEVFVSLRYYCIPQSTNRQPRLGGFGGAKPPYPLGLSTLGSVGAKPPKI